MSMSQKLTNAGVAMGMVNMATRREERGGAWEEGHGGVGYDGTTVGHADAGQRGGVWEEGHGGVAYEGTAVGHADAGQRGGVWEEGHSDAGQLTAPNFSNRNSLPFTERQVEQGFQQFEGI